MRIVTTAIVAAVLAAFGAVQLASDALCATAAAPYSLPAHVPIAPALAAYGVLDRAAPADYVEATLAAHALATGRLDVAERHALRLRPRPVRSELLAEIALRRGDPVLAREYFFAAPDIGALQREVRRIARRDPARAYAFEASVRSRLASLQTHPDAVAEASWIMGTLAARCARRAGPQRRAWLELALRDDLEATRLSPLSEKYLLAVAGAELHLGDRGAARQYERRVRSVDPTATLH